jgi:DNA-binding NtrC family response regulator
MPAKPRQKRILIVDDEAIVAFFLMEGLKGLGEEYEVRTTESAELALEQCSATPFDLAVVDYRLPGINGLDLIEQLRDISPDTRTIVITAYSSPELEEQAHRLHTCRYLAKPFRIQELMHTVEKVLA